MLELLREHQIGPRFRALMIGAQKAKGAPIALIAVPFWGKGAIKILGLGGGKNVWIICNLNSTARNPHVIENLKKLEGVKIRSHARLHAKIYAGPKFVIVGSSNASTNGLTEEGDAALGWIEANIATDNPQVVQLVRKLFDKLWNSRESLFQSFFVGTYNQDLGPNGKQKFASLRKGTIGPTKDLTPADFRKAWGYQFGSALPKDSWIIDLDCRSSKHPRVRGCAQVTGLQLKVRGEEDLMLALRGVAASPLDGRRLRISAEEKQLLVENASRIPPGFIPIRQILRTIGQRQR
jgi:hypothetical protein